MSDMDCRMMVKQYVAVVANKRGQRFRVCNSGDEKWYVFDPLIPGTDCSGCIPFPVLKTSLKRPLASALRAGWGNA